MALLTGFPLKEGWDFPQRLLMAGIGQLASPIQSAWVFAQVRNFLIDNQIVHKEIVPPQEVLACVGMELFRLRDMWFPFHRTPQMDLFQEAIEKWLGPHEGSSKSTGEQVLEDTPSQEHSLLQDVMIAEKASPSFSVSAGVEQPKAPVSSSLAPLHLPEVGNEPSVMSKQLEEEKQQLFETARAGSHVAEETKEAEFKPSEEVDKCTMPDAGRYVGTTVEGVGSAAMQTEEASERVELSMMGVPGPDVELQHPTSGCDQKAIAQAIPGIPPNLFQAKPSYHPGSGGPSHVAEESRESPTTGERQLGSPNQGVDVAGTVGSLSAFPSRVGQVKRKPTSATVSAEDHEGYVSPPTRFQAKPQSTGSAGPSHVVHPTKVGENEENTGFKAEMGRLGINDKTGGIVAFSSTRTQPCQNAEKPEQEPSPIWSTQQRMESEALAHAQFDKVTTVEKVAGQLVLFDFDVMSYHSIQVSQGQKASDLQNAMFLLTQKQIEFTDILGQRVQPEEDLLKYQVLATGTHMPEVPPQLDYRTLQLSGMSKREALFLQQGAVSVDEMTFYLHSLYRLTSIPAVSPLIITDLSQLPQLAEAWMTEVMGKEGTVVTAIWHRYHWIPIVVKANLPTPVINTTNEGHELWPVLFPQMSHSDVQVHIPCHLPTVFEDDCGFQTFAWVTCVSLQVDHPAMTRHTAMNWRSTYWKSLGDQGDKEEPRTFLLGGHDWTANHENAGEFDGEESVKPQQSPPTLFHAMPQSACSDGPSHVDTQIHEHREDCTEDIANRMLAGQVVILDFDVMEYSSFATVKGQRVRDLQKSMFQADGQHRVFLDITGHPVHPEEKTSKYPILAVGQQVPEVAANLAQRTAQLNMHAKREALFFQQGAVPVDEIGFYLQQLDKQVGASAVNPAVCVQSGERQKVDCDWIDRIVAMESTCVTAMWHKYHWIPVLAARKGEEWFFHTTHEGSAILPVRSRDQAGNPIRVQNSEALRSEFAQDCGFQAIAWLRAKFHERGDLNLSRQEAMRWRASYWESIACPGARVTQSFFLLGGQTELETSIAAILREHGVFSQRAIERAKQVIQTIGSGPVSNAMKSTRPWVALKELANSQNPKMRLIWEDEFDQVVKSRRKREPEFAAQRSKKQGRNNQVAVFTAQDVAIPPGVFCSDDDKPVAQVLLRNVNPNANGVVLVSEQEMQPFLSQKQISKEGLGFLVLAPFSADMLQMGEQVRFPAQCLASNEPVLLTAVLVQKGSRSVKRMAPPSPVQVDTVAT